MKGHSAANLAVSSESVGLADGVDNRPIVSANDAGPRPTPALISENGARIFRPDPSEFRETAKRAFDIVGAIGLLIFFAPIMAVIYAVVRSDGGAGVFAHERVGKDGVRFKCYKFRSMIPDADRVLKDLLVCNEQFRRDWNADQKLRNDPRITKVGLFLRKKSLDELPQLINVIKGDMSLVGPRPITADELERYGDKVDYYLITRPGLTGAWQVSGRNDVSYAQRVALDVDYARNWTFVADLMILLKTVRVVLSGHGAA